MMDTIGMVDVVVDLEGDRAIENEAGEDQVETLSTLESVQSSLAKLTKKVEEWEKSQRKAKLEDALRAKENGGCCASICSASDFLTSSPVRPNRFGVMLTVVALGSIGIYAAFTLIAATTREIVVNTSTYSAFTHPGEALPFQFTCPSRDSISSNVFAPEFCVISQVFQNLTREERRLYENDLKVCSAYLNKATYVNSGSSSEFKYCLTKFPSSIYITMISKEMPFEKIALLQSNMEELSSSSVPLSTNPLLSNYPSTTNVKDTMKARGTFICPSEVASNPVTQPLCSSPYFIERSCRAFKVENFQAGSPGMTDTACVASNAPSSLQLPTFEPCLGCSPVSNLENCINPPYFVYDGSGTSQLGSESGRSYQQGANQFSCPKMNSYGQVIHDCASQQDSVRSTFSSESLTCSSSMQGCWPGILGFRASASCTSTSFGGVVGNSASSSATYPFGSIPGVFSCSSFPTQIRDPVASFTKSLSLSNILISSGSTPVSQLSQSSSSPGIKFDISIPDIPLIDSVGTGLTWTIGSPFTNADFQLNMMTLPYRLAELTFTSLGSWISFPISFNISLYVSSTLVSSQSISIQGNSGSCDSSPCQQTLSLFVSNNKYFFLPGSLTYSSISDKKMQISVQDAKIVLHSFSQTIPDSITFTATPLILNSWAACTSDCITPASSFSQSLSSLQLPHICGRCSQYAAYVDDMNTRAPQACFDSDSAQLRTETQFNQQLLSSRVSYSGSQHSTGTFQRFHGGSATQATSSPGCIQSGSCSADADCCSSSCMIFSGCAVPPCGGTCSGNWISSSHKIPPIVSTNLDLFASSFVGTSGSDSVLLQFGAKKSLTADILARTSQSMMTGISGFLGKSTYRTVSSNQPFEIDLLLPSSTHMYPLTYNDVPWSVERNIQGEEFMFLYGLSSKRNNLPPSTRILLEGVGLRSDHLSQLETRTRTIVSQVQISLAQEGPFTIESRGETQIISAFGSVAGAAGAIFAIFTIAKKILTKSWKIYKPEDVTESHWQENISSQHEEDEEYNQVFPASSQ